MTDAYRPKGLSSALSYQDPKAAFRWLEQAFGFEPSFVILDTDGNLAHSEMVYGNSVLMVGGEWNADHKSPKSIGGSNTQSVHVQRDGPGRRAAPTQSSCPFAATSTETSGCPPSPIAQPRMRVGPARTVVPSVGDTITEFTATEVSAAPAETSRGSPGVGVRWTR